VNAERDARITAAQAVLIDFRRLVKADALRTGPQWEHWAGRLAAALGSVLPLDAGEIRGSRTASGVDAGTATILPADLPTVLGALDDAATLHRERAEAYCEACVTHPAGACDSHIDDLDQAEAYQALAARLGGQR
jgi:hypothetical protein